MASTNEKAERLAEWESDLGIRLARWLNAWRRSTQLSLKAPFLNPAK